MGYYDELGECDLSFYRQPCVFYRDGIDDNSCYKPNCNQCTYAIGRRPYCDFAHNGSCSYFNCWTCPEAQPGNEIVRLHQIMEEACV